MEDLSGSAAENFAMCPWSIFVTAAAQSIPLLDSIWSLAVMSLPVTASGIKTQRRHTTDDDDSCLREQRRKKRHKRREEKTLFFSWATTTFRLQTVRCFVSGVLPPTPLLEQESKSTGEWKHPVCQSTKRWIWSHLISFLPLLYFSAV